MSQNGQNDPNAIHGPPMGAGARATLL
jgi:hypothetical protein